MNVIVWKYNPERHRLIKCDEGSVKSLSKHNKSVGDTKHKVNTFRSIVKTYVSGDVREEINSTDFKIATIKVKGDRKMVK